MLSFSQIRNQQDLSKTSSFPAIAQAAILTYYLKPYPQTMPAFNGIDRRHHGGVHVSSTALNAEMIFELYKKYKPELLKHPITHQDLTENDLKLLKLAAIYHDSANISETHGNEIKHANNFRKDMCTLGWTREEIEPFAMAIQEKDKNTDKTILEKMIHDADCLDIIRVVGRKFDKNYLDVIKDLEICLGFSEEIDEIIENHFETIADFDFTESTFHNIGILHQFCETQENCYLAVYHETVKMLKKHIISSCLAKGKKVSEVEIDLSKISILELYNRKNSNILKKYLEEEFKSTTEIPSIFSSSNGSSSTLEETITPSIAISSLPASSSLTTNEPIETKKVVKYTPILLDKIKTTENLGTNPIFIQYILKAAASGVSYLTMTSTLTPHLYGVCCGEDHQTEIEELIKNILIQEYPHYLDPDSGESSLFTAAKAGDKSKVESLLKVEGMDYFSFRHPGDGKSAYQIALEQGHQEIASLIQKKIFESSFESFTKTEIAEILLDDMAKGIFETAGINIEEMEIEQRKKEKKEEEKAGKKSIFPSFTQHLKRSSKIPDLKGDVWFAYINELKDMKMHHTVSNPITLKTVDEWKTRDKKADHWTQTYIIKEKVDLNASKLGYISSTDQQTEDGKEMKIPEPKLRLDVSQYPSLPTASNHNSIWAQKLFSDMISNTDSLNEDEKISAKVITAIRISGHSDPERVYEQLIDFLKNHTVIVLGFNAKFLQEEGLEHYRPLNRWEREKEPKWWQKHGDYALNRLSSEKKLVKNIDTRLKKAFFANPEALHRYAALELIDYSNGVQSATTGLYGKSYLVLNNVVAFNSVFVAIDSFETEGQEPNKLIPATYHHLEILLAELLKHNKLDPLIERVIKGSLPSSYDFKKYMEAHIPPISLDCVDYIHINKDEYKELTQAEIQALSKAFPNTTITHSSENPHPATHSQFLSHIEKNEMKEAENLLKKYPFLMKVTNKIGEGPLHIAVKQGHYDLVKFLIKQGAPVNELAQGKAPLHLALELKENRFKTVEALITSCFEMYEGHIKKRRGLELDLNRLTYQPGHDRDRYTPLLTLLTSHEVDLQILDMLFKHGADIEPRALHFLSKLAQKETRNVPETLAQVFLALSQDEAKYTSVVQKSIFATSSEMNKNKELPAQEMKALESAKLALETEEEKLKSLNKEVKKLSSYAEINYSSNKLEILQARYIQLQEREDKLKKEEKTLQAKINDFMDKIVMVNQEFISATKALDSSQEKLKNAFFASSALGRIVDHRTADLNSIKFKKETLEKQLPILYKYLEANNKSQEMNKKEKERVQTTKLPLENHILYKNVLNQIIKQQAKVKETQEAILILEIKSRVQQSTMNGKK